MMRLSLTTLAVAVVAATPGRAQTAAPPIPLGHWQGTEDGFVVRIAPCGAGFCGTAAGLPRDSGGTRARPACGAMLLKNFVWNAKAGRWEGRLQPPDMKREIGSSIVSDGATVLTVKARMMLLSKTITFAPFRGTVTDDCRIQ